MRTKGMSAGIATENGTTAAFSDISENTASTIVSAPDYRLRRNDHLVQLGEEKALRHFTERL